MGFGNNNFIIARSSGGIHTTHKVVRSSVLSHLTGSFTGKKSAVCNTVQCCLQGVTLTPNTWKLKRLDSTLFLGKHYFFLGFSLSCLG